jgi:hypothetical protein
MLEKKQTQILTVIDDINGEQNKMQVSNEYKPL